MADLLTTIRLDEEQARDLEAILETAAETGASPLGFRGAAELLAMLRDARWLAFKAGRPSPDVRGVPRRLALVTP